MLCILLGRACLFTFGMLPHLSGKCICGTSSSAEYVGWARIKFAKIFSVTANKLIFVTVQFTVGSQCEAGRREQSGARRRRRRGAAPVLCRALRENSLHPTSLLKRPLQQRTARDQEDRSRGEQFLKVVERPSTESDETAPLSWCRHRDGGAKEPAGQS